jgi:hypothetical protein
MVWQCGPLLGTRLYPAAEGVYYVKGMSVCAGVIFFAALLALTLRQYLVRQNRKADEREAAQRAAMGDDEKMGNVVGMSMNTAKSTDDTNSVAASQTRLSAKMIPHRVSRL